MSKRFTLTTRNDFYDGWLAQLLGLPRPDEESAADGWDMGQETGNSAALALRPEIEIGGVRVEVETIP